jgi:hypothetical protein
MAALCPPPGSPMPAAPRPTLLALTGAALLATLLTGCGTTRSCGGNQDYLQARERPPVQLPEGITGSERIGAGSMRIPAAAPDAEKLDPPPRCLEEPPSFFRRAPGSSPSTPAAAPTQEAAPDKQD